MWQQNYEPVGGSLIASALVAAIPIAVLFFMLGVRRKPSWMAAITALAVAFVLALVAYRMPPTLALMAALTGAAYGLFPISWIVFSCYVGQLRRRRDGQDDCAPQHRGRGRRHRADQ